ncbi:MAG: NADH:flavin oxidoreductase/NADH oxidase [Betaproteobacteria bacterium]|jgi:2,4-dienoyl-CoA reductase-like NADH-dependent reductase (Old Yellow Enzyme family)|nr:MAG: NADH:flavin oxidoreductase/NADH oxidase [Betaproteobacteria bacterium]
MTEHLFSPITLNEVELPNRIVVSPMCQYMANDGSANDWHLMHYGQLSMGAGALLIFEATHVAPEGRISHRCLGLYGDDNEAALKRVVEFCRSFGVARLGVQLAHAGRKGSARTPIEGGKPLGPEESAWTTLAPSALPFASGWPTPRAMSVDDLGKVKQQFVDAAARAARIGFDVVEVHAGHGYLLHEFCSPISNRRDDEYGGSLENRMRFPLEVFEAVRAVLPGTMACGARITGSDWIDGGITADEMVAFASELKSRGCDFVDVTSGQIDPRQKIPFAPGYNVDFARRAKQEAGIAVVSVGLITQPQQAERIIAAGDADMVALARGAMDDPRWAWHAARELGVETTYPKNYQRCHPSVWQP